MKCKYMPLIAAVGLALSSAAADAQVVVVSAKSPVSSLTKEQVADLFLGKMPSLPGGGSAELVDQPESANLRDEFYSKVVGKSAAQAKQYWAKLAFTGKGTPPKESGSSADVKKQVAANPNAIGYIEKSAVDGSVKTVYSAQ